jgi:hypothetical protein
MPKSEFVARRAEIVEGDPAPDREEAMLLAQGVPVQYVIVSNLHGPVGSFPTRAEAFNHAKRLGIPTSGSGLTGGYKLKVVPISPGRG